MFLVAQAQRTLSAKLWMTATVIKKNKSFIERLTRGEPRIEPFGTPEMMFSKEPYLLNHWEYNRRPSIGQLKLLPL